MEARTDKSCGRFQRCPPCRSRIALEVGASRVRGLSCRRRCSSAQRRSGISQWKRCACLLHERQRQKVARVREALHISGGGGPQLFRDFAARPSVAWCVAIFTRTASRHAGLPTGFRACSRFSKCSDRARCGQRAFLVSVRWLLNTIPKRQYRAECYRCAAQMLDRAKLMRSVVTERHAVSILHAWHVARTHRGSAPRQ